MQEATAEEVEETQRPKLGVPTFGGAGKECNNSVEHFPY